MAKPGPDSILTEELTLKIRELVLSDKTYEEIKQELGIADGTWDSWVYKNYMDFRSNLQDWKHEKLVKKAEKNLNELLEGEDEKIRADLTKFTLERLNKAKFSSKSEVENSGSVEYVIREGDEIQGEERESMGSSQTLD